MDLLGNGLLIPLGAMAALLALVFFLIGGIGHTD